MQQVQLDSAGSAQALAILQTSPLFAALPPETLALVGQRAVFLDFQAEDTLTREGDPADSFFVVLKGECSVRVRGDGAEGVEIGRLRPPESLGEVGLLLDQARTATVVALEPVLAACWDRASFMALLDKAAGFSLGVCRGLARRLQVASKRAKDRPRPAREVLELLPVELMQRYRVLPLSVQEQALTVGFVDPPNPNVIVNLRPLLPGLDVRVEHIDAAFFDDVIRELQGRRGFGSSGAGSVPGAPHRGSPRLDAMLQQMVAEGASDLHLNGGQRPRWRMDGVVKEIPGASVLGAQEVWELFEPVLEPRSRTQFQDEMDADFAYSVPGVARFRCNLYRDHGGVGAALRQIPSRLLSLEQLGLPPPVGALCNHLHGLVLVTGPTGCGKSTTLASMVDHINRTRPQHILTLEDPIEFLHPSQAALVNQREVGAHALSFQRALRAALREDPDILLVGEMRDKETVALALETAATGHLVLGAMHTTTAVSAVDRVIDLFPPDQQHQVRSSLADTLRGVVAQSLCRKIGGGRVVALEVFIPNLAAANMIREGKTNQINSFMATNRPLGNLVLNEHLALLVQQRKLEFDDALVRSLDKPDLARRLNRELPVDRQVQASRPAVPARP